MTLNVGNIGKNGIC